MSTKTSSAHESSQDIVTVTGITLNHPQPIGRNCWDAQSAQPIRLNVHVALSNPFTVHDQDNLDNSVDYTTLTKRLADTPPPAPGSCQSFELFSSKILQRVLSAVDHEAVQNVKFELELPKAGLFTDNVVVGFEYDPRAPDDMTRRVRLDKLVVPTVIGLRDWEQERKQPLWVDVDVYNVPVGAVEKFVAFERAIVTVIEDTSYLTLETLANFIVKAIYLRFMRKEWPGASLRLKLTKPKAMGNTAIPTIEVYRSAEALASLV